MKFGWMTLSLSPSGADDLACVHQQLEQGVLAEAMGFDYLWLTEHNLRTGPRAASAWTKVQESPSPVERTAPRPGP